MNLNPLTFQSPPSRTHSVKPKSGETSDLGQATVQDGLAPPRTGLKVGAGLLAGLALLSATGCVAPPPSQPRVERETQTPQTHNSHQTPSSSDLRKDNESKEPLTELQLRERELDLRERELALREKEVGIYSRAEAQNNRLRTLQEQREAHEKAKRTGEAIGNTITILDGLGQIFGESVNQVLK